MTDEAYLTGLMYRTLVSIAGGFLAYKYFDLTTKRRAVIDAAKRFAAKTAAPFREVSIAFFNLKKEENTAEKSKKVAGTVARRIAYAIADYWLAILSAMLITTMKAFGYEFLYLFLAMWAFDMIVAGAFLAFWQRTGKDLTLGEDYRRAADVILHKSRLAGMLAIAAVLLQASFWSGPEHIVIFFRKEIRTETRMALSLLVLTAIQAIFWTAIYNLGYESVSELVK